MVMMGGLGGWVVREGVQVRAGAEQVHFAVRRIFKFKLLVGYFTNTSSFFLANAERMRGE